MKLDIKVGDRIYVVNQFGKFLRTIGWVGQHKVEWKWGWAYINSINYNTNSKVKFMVIQK